MNTWKENTYGAMGLFCTIGRNTSAFGQKASNFNKEYTFPCIRLVANGVCTLAGKVSEYSASLGEWTKIKFQAGEKWANEKYEQAKLDKDWRKTNEKYKDVKRKPRVRINLEEDVIECMIRPKKMTWRV